MNKEILVVVDSVSNQKGVSKEIIFDALELALATATKKKLYGEEVELRVAIDQETGDYETFRCWSVIDDEEEKEFPDAQLSLSEAKLKDQTMEVGQMWEESVESVEFGRIGAQIAKQVIFQKIREAERAQVVEAYRSKVSELVSGQVKKVTREAVIVDLGNNAEAILPREDWIPREAFRVGDRLRALLMEIRTDTRGPQLLLSRTAPEMLVELFKIEVPEIADRVVEIIRSARDPGSRAKIAVKTNDGRIDAVGACVGMRGSRVQAVSSELQNEKIEVVHWSDNIAEMAMNAMGPVEVISIVVDEDSRSMDIAVSEENLAQAIGRGGQNVKLASELTGWDLNIMTEEEAVTKQEEEAGALLEIFMEQLDVEEDVAVVLIEEGFTTIEEIAYVPKEEMMAIEGFDEEIVDELRLRARNALTTAELANEEKVGMQEPAEDLLSLEGMTTRLAYLLASRGVVTREDLAEQDIYDLLDIEDVSQEYAGQLIMAARAHWFEEEE